ncbi:epoxyqueuosine reductase QueH [Lachnospiraceae bacterium LCP25S3_G4]
MNYQKELDEIIKDQQEKGLVPKLLLHSCCAPCSSYVLEYLSQYFKITVFYYNPNIFPEAEYRKRAEEQQVLIGDMKVEQPIAFMQGAFERECFYQNIKGLENVKEGGERCVRCFRLRLERSAEVARDGGFDYFTTTLSISPLKNSKILNELGNELQEKYNVKYLPSDFKKKNGYQRSIELSKEYGLYRQNYCGCEFSKRERELDKKEDSMIH